MKYFIFLALFYACASGPHQLSNKAKELEIYIKKPNDCRVVGKVVGKDENGSKELALNHALNQAADLKASGISINQEVPNGKVIEVHATAHDCN
jgi:hypothetical protein